MCIIKTGIFKCFFDNGRLGKKNQKDKKEDSRPHIRYNVFSNNNSKYLEESSLKSNDDDTFFDEVPLNNEQLYQPTNLKKSRKRCYIFNLI